MNDTKEYLKEWDKKNRVQFNIRFNVNADKDILEWLKGKENLQGYIKKLIRKDIIRNG